MSGIWNRMLACMHVLAWSLCPFGLLLTAKAAAAS